MNRLFESAAQLGRLDGKTARAYEERKGVLAERVNQELLADSRLCELIGGLERIPLMMENHRNHALFLASMMTLNAWRLLASTLPWVYQTYLALGFHSSYFPVELGAWKKAIHAELPPSEAGTICHVYDWMLAQHDLLLDLSRHLPVPEPLPVTEPWQPFFDAILHHDLNRALAMAEKQVGGPDDLATFYQHTVRPALYEIGAWWAQGRITVADEHLATAVVNTVITAVRCSIRTATRRRGLGILSAVTAELHDLGARMITHCLETDGWEVPFLGANTPLSDLIDLTRRMKPAFIGLSVSMPYHLHHAQAVIDRIRNLPGQESLPILIGGAVFAMFPEARPLIHDAHLIDDCPGAVLMARSI
ncbi:MAG TPA: cobalamin-dependent protein [Candidatus Ozemobacteraceae bacterium]